jgi:hypothetical protein
MASCSSSTMIRWRELMVDRSTALDSRRPPQPTVWKDCGWRENSSRRDHLDIAMPGLNGWSALAAMKEDPGAEHRPGFTLRRSAGTEEGLPLGAAACLTKPVDHALADTLNRLTGRGGGHSGA